MLRRVVRALILACEIVALACGRSPSSPSGATAPPPPEPANSSALNSMFLSCPSAAQIDSLIPLRIEFDDVIRSGPLACRYAEGSADLTAQQRTIYWSLLFLRNTRFNVPLPWTTGDAWSWFVGLNPRVYFYAGSPGPSHCTNCQNPATAELDIAGGAPTAPSWPQVVVLASGLVHEARHIEVGNHRCGTLDVRPEDLEAFGVHYYYLVWTARHTDAAAFPAEYRAYLEWSTCAMRNSAFCTGSC
jgi:hypothetical protein